MYGREELTEKPLSRVGRRPIPVPAGVEIDILTNGVTVKGPKGSLTQTYHPEVKVSVSDDNEIIVERLSDRKFHHKRVEFLLYLHKPLTRVYLLFSGP